MSTNAPENYVDTLKEESYISEFLLIGMFWNNPSYYTAYPIEKIGIDSFLNPICSFYFGLGRHMADQKIAVFDDVVVYKAINELKLNAKYDKYGGFQTISDIMSEVSGKEDNFDAYYEEVKKYQMIKNLYKELGEKVVKPDGKYDYHRMSREQLHTFWLDRINRIGLDGDSHFQESFLLQNLEEKIEKWDKEPDIGLEFFESRRLTEICKGWANGTVYMHGGFSGKGKTAFTVNKIIPSCIQNNEPLVIIANEQDEDEWSKLLITTAIGAINVYNFKRSRLLEGGFTEEERKVLSDATTWIKDNISVGDDGKGEKLIVLVFMDTYNMDNVKKTVLNYVHRGYSSFVIDTAKPSDDANTNIPRWERFYEDVKGIYKLTKKDGGYNLKMWVNVQLADSALNMRYLDFGALGESKKIKNEVGVLFCGRHLFDDEYEGEKRELTCWRMVPNPDYDFNDDAKPYKREMLKLPRYKKDEFGNIMYKNHYYLLFTPKNRRGQDNTTGQEMLVYRVNFNNNTWHEHSYTTVPKDF